jgi:hypothetical protein
LGVFAGTGRDLNILTVAHQTLVSCDIVQAKIRSSRMCLLLDRSLPDLLLIRAWKICVGIQIQRFTAKAKSKTKADSTELSEIGRLPK